MEDLPPEVIIEIYGQVFEKDRRSLKRVSSLLHACYCSYVLMSKRNPPKYLRLCPYVLVNRPCNAVRRCEGPIHRDSFNGELYTVYHDCMCGILAFIGALRQWSDGGSTA